MKRITLLLLSLFALTFVRAQLVYPEFSTEDAPVWYIVQFKTGSAVLGDQGAGTKLKTVARTVTDATKWQLIGTKDGFRMKSASGNYVNYSSASGRFTTATLGTELKMVPSTNASASECFEIQLKNSSQSMNQFGGAGANRELGQYAAGDPNNPLSFVAVSPKKPEFSTDETEAWYYLRFCRDGGVMAGGKDGDNATVGAFDAYSQQYTWKLTGTAGNFQMVSRDGLYAAIKGTGDATRLVMQSAPYAPGFKLKETENGSYAPAWELQTNDEDFKGKSINQWTGTSIGNPLGMWNANDNNNPFNFLSPDEIVYPDFMVTPSETYRPASNLSLWYTEPASVTTAGNKWMEYSLPVGNGQFGASLTSGVQVDEIQFNEKTLWSGSPTKYGAYQNFGSVKVENIDPRFGFSADKAAANYYRCLDLTTGQVESGYTTADGSVGFTRQYAASRPDGCVMARYAASVPGNLHLRITLESGKPGVAAKTSYVGNEASFAGKLDLLSYNVRLRVVPVGGEMTVTEEGITVTGADEVLLVLVGATDYDPSKDSYISGTAFLSAQVKERVAAAAEKGWNALSADQVADHKSLFDRMNLNIGQGANIVPTNVLVDTYNKGKGTHARLLEALYFAYGRYLGIASSRGVDLPSNLQGIWNNSSTPPWSSDIHANINVQMNYWAAETTNLSETHLPFLNYIINQATNRQQWRQNAVASGQSVGWTLYTENNIFGGGSTFMMNYVIANAWYCTHLWQHYRYTLDRDFLLKAFPAMWTCSEYWMQRLVKGADGSWECPDEYSPEQGPGAENATAHSQQLVAELFANTLEAIRILGDDCEVSETEQQRLADYYEKLDKGLATETYDGVWGVDRLAKGALLLREWKYSPFSVGELNHRHMSQLMCLYPFCQVTASSPYFTPAVNSMKLRGDASTGWSMGWKINLWARAGQAERAYGVLSTALRHSTSYGTNQNAGGIYYNLFDSHSPFQIDGNFGACSGMTEMVLQSHSDTLLLLPALPAAWKNGDFRGIKAVGDFTVDAVWADGKPVSMEITSNKGMPLFVSYPGISGRKVSVNGKEVKYRMVNANTIEVPATIGERVTIDFAELSTGVETPVEGDAATGIRVTGRTVTLLSSEHGETRVCDVAGRTLFHTSETTFKLPRDKGHVFIIEVDGKSHKVSVE